MMMCYLKLQSLKLQKTQSLSSWCQSINGLCLWYLYVYLLWKVPNSIMSLVKYGFNTRPMSKQFGCYVARAYDESFRKVRKLLNFDWAVVNDDLWRRAFYDQYKPSQNSNNKNLGKVNKQVSSSPFQRRAQQSSPFSSRCMLDLL